MHVLWLILFDFLKCLVAFIETREWLVSYERPMIISIQACHICMHCKVMAFTFKSLEKALCIFYNTWKLTHTQNLNKGFFFLGRECYSIYLSLPMLLLHNNPRQYWLVETITIWPSNMKIFALWSITGKVYQFLKYFYL